MDIINDIKFGDFFRNARLELHLTQDQFAEKVGISLSYYKDIERNLALPSLKVFFQIVTVLNLSIDNIIYKNQNFSKKYKELQVMLTHCNEKQLSVLIETSKALIDTYSDTD